MNPPAPPAHRCPRWSRPLPAWLAILLWLGGNPAFAGSGLGKAGPFVTQAGQFKALTGADFLAGCDFRLTGVITLVDSNRNLVVVQDDSGAVAIDYRFPPPLLQAGQQVTLEGSDCSPLFLSFPDFPYRPAGREVRGAFETPSDWGEYNLTRMRGYLRPTVTGDYRFWIASDNSSELWLSTDASPANARNIGSVLRFKWANPREWTRYPSQNSDLIRLQAGQTYYIEAIQEQTTEGENLAVAWQGPGFGRTVIDGRHLLPWQDHGDLGPGATSGILREYWTNYPNGSVEGMAGARPFESTLTVREMRATILGSGAWPAPVPIHLDQPLRPNANYQWGQVVGMLKFKAEDGNAAWLELSDGQAVVQIRARCWNPDLARQWEQTSNRVVQVTGVCEGLQDQNGVLLPGLIWTPAAAGISFVAGEATNLLTRKPSTASAVTNAPAVQGFLGTRGIVTFNGRALNQDYIFIQEDNAAELVVPDKPALKQQLQVGNHVDIGGMMEPGKPFPVITPLFVINLGWHAMPPPCLQPPGLPPSSDMDGKWSEWEGVVHLASTNGMLYLVGKAGPAWLWLGQTDANSLAHYVGATLRARGVLRLNLLSDPVLLVPSRDFVEVAAAAPADVFDLRRSSIADLLAAGAESAWAPQVHVQGEVTYCDHQSFFIQDTSGGIRVRTDGKAVVQVGDTLDVVAFAALNNYIHILTEPLLRPAATGNPLALRDFDLSEALSPRQSGSLVRLNATLLAVKKQGSAQRLELQEQQRVLAATLPTDQGRLPALAPGSRLQITGVRDDEATTSPAPGDKPLPTQMLPASGLLLRTPRDVVILSGPPWWTWKRTATLVGMLLTILAVAFLWVFLLQRRLERQQASQLAFSRHVLERLEDERRRIAANLHDSLGQTLLVIKNHALLAIQRPVEAEAEGEGVRQRLDEISGVTSQAIEEVRRITHGLRPYQLDRLGLTQAIRTSVTRAAENNPMVFASRVEDIDGVFDKDAEIHVYRIVQEAVTNAVKHSAATELAVVIKKRTPMISLSIRDNGRGFDPTKPYSQAHDLGYGLSGIAERVRILGGTWSLESHPGEGTSLTVQLPFPTLKT